MTRRDFKKELRLLLATTLDEGPGPHWAMLITALALFDFICNEAGAETPNRINEIVSILQERLQQTERAMSA